MTIFLYPTGLQRYKIPQGEKKIMFRPSLKQSQTGQGSKKKSSPTELMPNNRSPTTVAMSSTVASQEELTIKLEEDNTYYCIECDANLNLEGHFK